MTSIPWRKHNVKPGLLKKIQEICSYTFRQRRLQKEAFPINIHRKSKIYTATTQGRNEAQRIKEGKCKFCGDKWDPKHRCLQKKLYACEAEEGELEVKEPIENEADSQPDYQIEIEDDTPKISLVAITGISQPQTLKIKGHIKNNNITVLIDSDSTHKFVNVNLAKVFNLFIRLVPNMTVMIADGKKIDNVGRCHKFKLQMQEYNLESDFIAVPLGGVNVVLGIQWLQTLGAYSKNHQEHFI